MTHTVDGRASDNEVREEVLRTIIECQTAAEHLERQLEQRRFIVSFLRQYLDRPASRDRTPSPRDRSRVPPVPPVRLRHRARQYETPPAEQDAQVIRIAFI